MLQYIGIDTDLSTETGFFKHPWKHFPLADVYASCMAGLDEEAGQKENDPTEGSPEETIDQTVIDAQDAADADAVISARSCVPTRVSVVTTMPSWEMTEQLCWRR